MLIAACACLGTSLTIAAPCAARTVGSTTPPAITHHAIPEVVSAVKVAGTYGIVTSIFRSAAHNRAVGGVRNSHHLRGAAIDVARRRGVSHQLLEAALLRAGYLIIESLDERDHSHFAFAGRRLFLPGGDAVAPMSPADARQAANNPAPKPTAPALAADQHGSLIATAAPLIGDEPHIRSAAGAH